MRQRKLAPGTAHSLENLSINYRLVACDDFARELTPVREIDSSRAFDPAHGKSA